jgi:putative hydrolase of the HAD superfamily
MNQSKRPAPFAHVRDWVFDLDNTLYPRHCDLFGQIDLRMTAYVSRLTGLEHAPARVLQKQLYREHGTTLNGLMNEYGIDPHHFLADVHDIDYSAVPGDPRLGQAIAALPGRKLIFTNGDVRHAENTLGALGFAKVFDATFDIIAARFEPKPNRSAYDRFLGDHRVDPKQAAMFEDLPRNLEPAKQIGMATVLVVPASGPHANSETWEVAKGDEDHIDHVTDDLAGFLETVLGQ